jgi:NADH-quinone oxidoreductase subunit N
MEAIVIIFISALISLFLGILKKPTLVMVVSIAGLAIGAIVQNYEWYFLNEKYQLLDFNDSNIQFLNLAVTLTGIIILSGYKHFMDEPATIGDFSALMLFSLSGGLCLIGFKDLFMFFLGLEILSIPLYVLAGSKKKSASSSEAALKYFYLGSFATALLLFGIALVYGTVGTFNIEKIGFISMLFTDQLPSMFFVGVLFMLAAMLFKVGAFPFHFWVADVYQGSPSVFMTYMSSVVKLIGIYAFYRLFGMMFPGVETFWTTLIVIAIFVSMFIGNLSALNQDTFKRLMAFSSITNGAYALMTVLTYKSGSDALLVYMVGYGFSVVALMTINMLVNDNDDKLSSLSGIGYKNPLIGVVGIVALLSVAGIPPMTGFFGKAMVFYQAFEENMWLVSFALLNSAIGVYIYLKITMTLMKKDDNAAVISLNWSQQLVLSISLLALLFGWTILYF